MFLASPICLPQVCFHNFTFSSALKDAGETISSAASVLIKKKKVLRRVREGYKYGPISK
jgi:hypothetical protein